MTRRRGKGRSGGLLLHLTSLPGHEGIGTMGPDALRFAADLREMGLRWWQVLPIGPTAYGDSPYQATSTFAGNPLLIDLEGLVIDGLLGALETDRLQRLPMGMVDYSSVIPIKQRLLALAASRFLLAGADPEYAAFRRSTRWLYDFALYTALKDEHNGLPWPEWDPPLALREERTLLRAARRLAAKVERVQVIQFFFQRQWDSLREECRRLGVGLIGDLPIYLAHDSADVWGRPELVRLDQRGLPTVVGGVPPDYYSPTGQLWGNPLYDWEVDAADDYSWWADRLHAALTRFDLVRIDHFRGFSGYWEVPAGEPTAEGGRWVPGPGAELFEALTRRLGSLPIIAEDLGYITEDVHALRKRFGFPGMRVATFGFGSDPGDELHHPANYPLDVVAYTSTHDSEPTYGWFWQGNPGHDRRRLRGGPRRLQRQLHISGEEVHWDLARMVMGSRARLAVVPVQDLLGLGSEGRMNTPGREEGNWRWRMAEPLPGPVKERVHKLTEESDRGV